MPRKAMKVIVELDIHTVRINGDLKVFKSNFNEIFTRC